MFFTTEHTEGQEWTHETLSCLLGFLIIILVALNVKGLLKRTALIFKPLACGEKGCLARGLAEVGAAAEEKVLAAHVHHHMGAV